MVRAKVAPLLAKDFVILDIDTERTVGGQEMFDRYKRGRSGGLPWFCFLDEKGNVLADSVGADGNVGCPWTDDEIGTFGGLLGVASRHLTEADVATMASQMRLFREEFEKKRREKAAEKKQEGEE